MDEPKPYAVPAAPNESVIHGKVVQVRPAPGGAGTIWDVEVIESKDVEPRANFTRSRVGESIAVYVHPDLKKKIEPGDLVKARVFFQGDERSGVFFLKDDDVSRQK
jgi:hypothetical protein